MVPPESISNSEVKRSIADGSVGFPHVRVGRCRVLDLVPLERGEYFRGFNSGLFSRSEGLMDFLRLNGMRFSLLQKDELLEI